MPEPILPLGPVGVGGVPPPAAPAQAPGSRRDAAAFGELLNAKLGKGSALRFSGHALERIARRGIDVSDSALARLQGGVARAAAKGSRESLVLLDDTAFVVSIRNRTVVTAVDREHMREQVFTNIDSAVIA